MVIQLSQVSPEPLKWIWTERVARRMITILEGHPGEGTSLITLAIAASVSAGRPCPGDGVYSSPGRVLLVCPEDDLATTVLPRLRAFDAHPDNIIVPQADEMERTLKDPALLATIIKKARPDLVIIDPVKAADR
jgi:RecA-family ATPase